MAKRRKNKKNKKIILLIGIFLIVVIGIIIVIVNNKKDNDSVPTVKVVDTISEYDYTTYDTDTKLFKDKYNELKEILSHSKVDNAEYSKLVAELFIIDFFTLDNKVSKNDVGGVQFVYSNYKTSFIDKARDEFYKYVDNNLGNDRKQELPEVSNISINSCESTSLKGILDSEEFKIIDEAYKVKLSWEYKKDLGYQKDATVIVVKDGDNKFSVAKLYKDA